MKNTILVALFICVSISSFAQSSTTVADDKEFLSFLENMLENESVNAETTKELYQKSWSYWSEHQIDYNQSPKKYNKVMALYHKNQQKFKKSTSIKIDRYED